MKQIEAVEMSIEKLLNGNKFFIDEFQREYTWEEKHIEELITDLINAFHENFTYDENITRDEAYEKYTEYFLGSIVLSDDNTKKSIIDGQQRITSITLILIYLYNKTTDEDLRNMLSKFIYSSKRGSKDYNLSDKYRKECMDNLYNNRIPDNIETYHLTIKNMYERYIDIQNKMSLKEEEIPYFADWLLEKVIFAVITSYSEEKAYSIFETMNDRGSSLTSSELLKGYVISKIQKNSEAVNNNWKENIIKLQKVDKNAEQTFFQVWFRAKFAETIRERKENAKNQDFENIASKFHLWFKSKYESKEDKTIDQEKLQQMFKNEPNQQNEFTYFVDVYINISNNLYHLKCLDYISKEDGYGIAQSLQMPLLIAPIIFGDDEETVKNKIQMVSAFIERFTIIRGLNQKNFGQTSISYTFYNKIKEIRDKNIDELKEILKENVDTEINYSGIKNFKLNSQNKKFAKHFLTRVSEYIDSLGDNTLKFKDLKDVSFQIEHFLPDHYEWYKDKFEDKENFDKWRNSLGAMGLLKIGNNQSLGDMLYSEKRKEYLKQNKFLQILTDEFTVHNPNYTNNETFKAFGFLPCDEMTVENITKRLNSLEKVCKEIWK